MAERVRIEFEGDMSQLRAELKKVLNDADNTGGKGGRRFGKGFSQGFKDAFAGFTAANLATRGIDAAFGLINTAIDEMLAKETALADFSAITGVTGDRLAEFGDAAEQLSNKFGTSVVENIEAMKGLLSRLGPDIANSKDALSSMTDTVNTLSKASGLNATQSMDALTTAMLQFGVDLSDPVAAAAEMADMMNVMAAGAKEGAAEIPAIAEALKQSGSTAKGLNISFEETNAAIQALAQSGKFGSEAGVALRNMLASLARPSSTAEQALAKINLSATELSDVMTTQGLEAALQLFNNRLQDIPSLAEQAAIKISVFEKENLAAASGVLSVVESQGLLTDKLGETDTAYEQAAINMSTRSEMMKRASTNAMNEIVGGMEMIADNTTESFGQLTMEIDQSADAFGQLLRLDLEGFWDTLTTGVYEYNAAKEEQIRLDQEWYRKTSQQLDEKIKQTARRAQAAALEEELNKKLERSAPAMSGTKRGLLVTEFGRLFREGVIDSIDEFFLRTREGTVDARMTLNEMKEQIQALKNEKGGLFEGEVQKARELDRQIAAIQEKIDILEKPKKSKAAASSGTEEAGPLAGSLAALKDERDEIMRVIEEDINPEVDPDGFESMLTYLRAVNEEIEQRNALIEGAPPMPDLDFELPEGAQPEVLQDLAEDFNHFESAGRSALVGITAGFQAMGGAMGGARDAGTEVLRSIVGNFITAMQAELIASKAAAFAKAIPTFGLSLIQDAPFEALGWAALETAKGYLNSLDTGGVLRSDQFIRAHADETIIPPRDAPRYFAAAVKEYSDTPSRTRRPYKPPRPVKTVGKVKHEYTHLAQGMRNVELRMSRGEG